MIQFLLSAQCAYNTPIKLTKNNTEHTVKSSTISPKSSPIESRQYKSEANTSEVDTSEVNTAHDNTNEANHSEANQTDTTKNSFDERQRRNSQQYSTATETQDNNSSYQETAASVATVRSINSSPYHQSDGAESTKKRRKSSFLSKINPFSKKKDQSHSAESSATNIDTYPVTNYQEHLISATESLRHKIYLKNHTQQITEDPKICLKCIIFDIHTNFPLRQWIQSMADRNSQLRQEVRPSPRDSLTK